MHSESSGPVPHLKGGGHIAAGKGGSKEEGGGRKGGEGAEGGADGAMDGNNERARVGKEGQMSHGVMDDGNME